MKTQYPDPNARWAWWVPAREAPGDPLLEGRFDRPDRPSHAGEAAQHELVRPREPDAPDGVPLQRPAEERLDPGRVVHGEDVVDRCRLRGEQASLFEDPLRDEPLPHEGVLVHREAVPGR